MLKKTLVRLKRKLRVRVKITGTLSRPRLSVYRSNINIYAQLVDDTTGQILCSASDLKMKKE
jgi:large subunit ribosomal protein L18